MVENEDVAELLFFDTFSHEVDTDVNLDLVQFPKPVFITQVRIIPLGARVHADFPGGVRLGATNPSKFDIEFFVNDLGIPGASTFENLGHLEYNQNDCIHLECAQEKIPTDGLVLRGWYSTITLAVYGILTNSVNEHIASPPPIPCETAGPEEICNSSRDARISVLQEETLKGDWKEPPSNDVTHTHKPSVNDYEQEDLDYGLTIEHYHHSGDERERRLRKSSHSSESKNRAHSESNERDFIRTRSEREIEKSTREWSHSPEYTRHARRKRSERSRSDAEETHKWPRTPPASIDSPSRPRSPDNMEYADEELHFKSKSRTYTRANDSPTIANSEVRAADDDGTPDTPDEQFEPILSDDEIIGDNDFNTETDKTNLVDEPEAELNSAAASAEPAIIEFDPFKMPICNYIFDMYAYYDNEVENLRLILKKFGGQTNSVDLESFKSTHTTAEEREKFVFLSEQLINQLAYLTQHYKRRNFVLQQFFKSDTGYMQQVFGILQIALDFDSACMQLQPAIKIRHIKVGARLAELLGPSDEFMKYMLDEKRIEPFAVLFKLYQQNFMAVSIKLMLLKAVYALLDTKAGIRCILGDKLNGYQWILETFKQTHLTRTKYALHAIVKKMNLNEALECIHENCTKLFVLANYCKAEADGMTDKYQLIEEAIELVLDAIAINALSYQQPRRFLPVSKKFEIVTDAMSVRSFANTLQMYFAQNRLAESLLLLLSNAADLSPSLLIRTIELLEALLQTHVGVDYFIDDCFDTTKLMVATLLFVNDIPINKMEGTTADADDVPKDEKCELKSEAITERPEMDKEITLPAESPTLRTLYNAGLISEQLHHLQKLGIELAYKVQTRYHLDAITSLLSSYDAPKLTSHLHALYSQTCRLPGRQHTVALIGINNHVQIFTDLIKKEQRLQTQRQLTMPNSKYKSPVLSYAVDMVDCCVRYCENLEYLIEHGAAIRELAKNHETFEPSVSAVLQEMFVYLKPLEAVDIFSHDDITPLVEVISRSLEYITTFPGDLIMALRILRHLTFGSVCNAIKSGDTEELKHRFVVLQFYSVDGVQTLLQILEKLCAYFEQPGLHTPALMTAQGVSCCQIILPTLSILRAMLSFAIQCRDVKFKDLTAIDYLIKTYYLLHYFPANSQAAAEVELAKNEIIKTLLAYTQPNEQDEEFLHKSLWTQMVREILKNIDGPSTFMPGLQVLIELLPLPLPLTLPVNVQLAQSQMQRLITERKLWSAHLHPQTAQIAKLIETIAPTSFPPLSDIMRRVCLQLADLAPNMTLLISKTLAESLYSEWSTTANATSQHLWRLLNFFAKLTAYPSVKSSALSILSGKLWDIFQAILMQSAPTDCGFKCQVAVHRILESFFDSEISLISTQSPSPPELNLASALPPKELIPRIIDAIVGNLLNVDVTHEVSALCVRNMVILTEHDITFYHLSFALKQRADEFQRWLLQIIEVNESGTYNSNVESLVLLLRSLTQLESVSNDITLPKRTLKLQASELEKIFSLRTNIGNLNVLHRIRAILKKSKAIANDALLNDVDRLIINLEKSEGMVVKMDEDAGLTTEPILPQAQSIVTQYLARPIFAICDTSNDDTQFGTHYWPERAHVDAELETQCERVKCDLTELAKVCLSTEVNLTSDCKRVLHLSASPQSNRERTPTAPFFRTRRVEVEPSTGRPEKKIYITRGRGFPRGAPARSDLFRSRPPNTSRPPSLHVDDFLALENCGAQPTGPTGYNKIPSLMRGSRVGRNRGSRLASSVAYRKPKMLRTSSPSAWNENSSHHYRTATIEPHFGGESHYPTSSHFVGRSRGRSSRGWHGGNRIN